MYTSFCKESHTMKKKTAKSPIRKLIIDKNRKIIEKIAD